MPNLKTTTTKKSISSIDFTEPTDFTLGSGGYFSYSDMQLADVNADGKTDVVTVNTKYTLGSNNNITVLLGDGKGNFSPPTTFAMGNPYIVMSFGDVNGDGKLDLVATKQNSDGISVLLGDGKGNFAHPSTFSVNNYATALNLVDVNGDNKLDVVTKNHGDISMLLGDGSSFP